MITKYLSADELRLESVAVAEGENALVSQAALARFVTLSAPGSDAESRVSNSIGIRKTAAHCVKRCISAIFIPMTPMKRAIVICIFLLIFALFVSKYSSTFHEYNVFIIDRETLVDRYWFGSRLYFIFSADVYGERAFRSWEVRNLMDNVILGHRLSPDSEFITDLIFAYSEADAMYFPNNIIVAWPWELSHRFVDEINRDLESRLQISSALCPISDMPVQKEIYIPGFNLTYPVTMADVIGSWEEARELRDQLRRGTLSSNQTR